VAAKPRLSIQINIQKKNNATEIRVGDKVRDNRDARPIAIVVYRYKTGMQVQDGCPINRTANEQVRKRHARCDSDDVR